jgi:hypothetical protein
MVKYLLAIASTVALTSCSVFGDTYADVTLVNVSADVVRHATVEVAWRQYVVTDLAPMQRHTISFVTAGDGSYDLSVRFASGEGFEQRNIGYVSAGISSRDEILIRDGSAKYVAGRRPDAEAPLPLTPHSSEAGDRQSW